MAANRNCKKCDTPANRQVILRKKKTVRGKEVIEDTPTNEYQCNCGRSIFSGTLTGPLREPVYVDHLVD